MESRIEEISTPTNAAHTPTSERIMAELKAFIQRTEEKAVERAKAADRLVRDHPYQTVGLAAGLAFGLGLLLGVLARRK